MSAQVLKLETELELLKERMFIASALGLGYHEAPPSASEPLPSVSSANATSGKTQRTAAGKNMKLNRSVCHDPLEEGSFWCPVHNLCNVCLMISRLSRT